jgi:hypothetical protein
LTLTLHPNYFLEKRKPQDGTMGRCGAASWHNLRFRKSF